ncbi:MAG TPA: M24 family metallopeptidase, partial [Anaerolineales bacterium]|nr:M24 family metallopeptidase [Anaerolineales bacterium]
EAQGHDTIRQNPAIQEGYVHSVGHGLGLHVHEAPWSGSTATEKDILAPGAVFTIEPGLYYPSRGMGCRLEDTFTVLPNGTIERLAEFPHDLVLPMSA